MDLNFRAKIGMSNIYTRVLMSLHKRAFPDASILVKSHQNEPDFSKYYLLSIEDEARFFLSRAARWQFPLCAAGYF